MLYIYTPYIIQKLYIQSTTNPSKCHPFESRPLVPFFILQAGPYSSAADQGLRQCRDPTPGQIWMKRFVEPKNIGYIASPEKFPCGVQ